MDPLISVIIPTFNRSQVLKRAIISALNQTYRNIELVVVNDASTDSSSDIVKSINDSRIKLIVHEKNKGLAAARNTGIGNSAGEYITFLDDDDEWLPEKISLQLDAIRNANLTIGLVFTNGFSEYENNLIIKEDVPSGVVFDPKINTFFPLRVLITPPSGWMLSKTIVEKIGFFDESMYNNWDDGDYFVRVALSFPIYFLNKKLVIWHALASHVNMISLNLIKGKEIFLEKNLKALKKDRRYLFNFYRTLGKDTLKIDKKRARSHLFRALRMRPYDSSTIAKIFRTIF